MRSGTAAVWRPAFPLVGTRPSAAHDDCERETERRKGEQTHPNSRTDAEREMSDGAMIDTVRMSEESQCLSSTALGLREVDHRTHPTRRSPRRTRCRTR